MPGGCSVVNGGFVSVTALPVADYVSTRLPAISKICPTTTRVMQALRR